MVVPLFIVLSVTISSQAIGECVSTCDDLSLSLSQFEGAGSYPARGRRREAIARTRVHEHVEVAVFYEAWIQRRSYGSGLRVLVGGTGPVVGFYRAARQRRPAGTKWLHLHS